MKQYILNEQLEVVETTPEIHSKWCEDFRNRIIKKTRTKDAEVSTVFLTLNYTIDQEKPILFETMVFGGKYDDYQRRYCTYEEALKGHDEIIKMVSNE